MPPRRRRTTAHFPKFDPNFELSLESIVGHLEEIDKEDDAGHVCVVQRIYEQTLLKEVISMPEFATLRTQLAEISAEDARALLEEIKSLSCAEARVVEWSPELTHATCSNTAPYHLGAGKTALGAMFYLVKYLGKEAGSPNTALSILIDARDHIDKYGSKGPDANSPQRFARHLLSRCVNKGDQELSGTQSASVVLGHKSYHCTDITAFVDNHCALQCAKEMWDLRTDTPSVHDAEVKMADEECGVRLTPTGGEPRTADDGAEAIEAEEEAASAETKFDSGQPRVQMFDSDDDDDDGAAPQSNSKVYTIPKGCKTLNCVVTVSQGMNYRHRGEALRLLNYVEYCNMVTIVKHVRRSVRPLAAYLCAGDGDNEEGGDTLDPSEQPATAQSSCGPGRKGSKFFDLGHGHPLCKWYVQVIREKFIVPIRAGGTRPTFPTPLDAGASPSNAWLKQHEGAAAFYSSNFVPWSDSDTPDLSAAHFRRWVYDQNLVSKDEESHSFPQRLIACGRLQEFRNYAFLNQLSKNDLQMNRQYRQRNRKMWTEEEIAEFFNLCGGTKGKKRAEDEVEALRQRQEARKTDEQRMDAAVRNEDWMTQLADDVNRVFGAVENATTPSLDSLRGSLHCGHASPAAADVAEASENLYKAAAAENEGDAGIQLPVPAQPHQDFDLETAGMHSQVPYYFDVPDQRKYPKELERISDENFALEKNEWDRRWKDDLNNGVPGTPRSPSNPEQRELARSVLKKVREARLLNIDLADGDTQPEAIDDQSSVGIMVVGAPGVGKSHTISTISFFLQHENLGTVISSAWTGVATLQVFWFLCP